jgi:hypothetical protein
MEAAHMEKLEFLEVKFGRKLYEVMLEAIHAGATLDEMEEVGKQAYAKAYKAMESVGIVN